MDSIETLILIRGAERIAIIALAGLLFWMAWKFFFHSFTAEDQEIEVKGFGLALKMQKFSPALLFTLLGTGLLYFSVHNGLVVERQTGPLGEETTRLDFALNDIDDQEIMAELAIFNAIINLSKGTVDGQTTDANLKVLSSDLPYLMGMRRDFLVRHFGEEGVRSWERYRVQLSQPLSIPEEERAVVTKIEEVLDGTP